MVVCCPAVRLVGLAVNELIVGLLAGPVADGAQAAKPDSVTIEMAIKTSNHLCLFTFTSLFVTFV
jgi:hypothetical protein